MDIITISLAFIACASNIFWIVYIQTIKADWRSKAYKEVHNKMQSMVAEAQSLLESTKRECQAMITITRKSKQ